MTQSSLFNAASSGSDEPLTMTSREIAELTGKEHSNVMRDIRNMVEELKQDSKLNFACKSSTYKADTGQSYNQYELDKDTTLTLMLGYDAVARMKVVKRWQALETGKAQPATAQQPTVTVLAAPPLVDVCNALVATVGAKVMSRKEGAELIRAITLASFHGSNVLMDAAKQKPTVVAPRSTHAQPSIQDDGFTPYELRAKGTETTTRLLDKHGVRISAKALFDAMEKLNMASTRHEANAQATAYRILTGEGLRYGQNVMSFDGERSHPYLYVAKFDGLLGALNLDGSEPTT